jgi:hypothetical protein
MRLQANFTQSAVQPVITSFMPCMDQFLAMVANIEQIRQLDDDTFNFTYPCALQNDVLHYGQMLKADDKQFTGNGRTQGYFQSSTTGFHSTRH